MFANKTHIKFKVKLQPSDHRNSLSCILTLSLGWNLVNKKLNIMELSISSPRFHYLPETRQLLAKCTMEANVRK